MFPIISARESLLVVGLLFVLVMTSARLLQPEWWQSRAVRIATFLSFGGMLTGVVLLGIGRSLDRYSLMHTGAGIAYVGILVLAPAILSLPLAAILDRLLTRLLIPRPLAPALALAPAPAPAPAPALSRRAFIRAGTATLPALGAITGAKGFLSANAAPRIPVIPMRYENLHPDLDGLRILQLSDLHLGAYAGLDDLAKALEAATLAQRPDLIVLTGDLADDIALIPGALELVARAGARHGGVASLGNHEYLHDIKVTRPLYEASAIPLLVSSGRTLEIGRARLFIGGADDPVHMHGDVAGMLRPSIMRAASHGATGADFRLLLCHRPEGFGPAAEAGFDLTLSGHTHGGQLGLFGRSLLEKVRPGTGWWGTYSRRRPDSATARRTSLSATPSRLYTTSGFGHWFPFRIGCPTETPLIVLERAPSRAPAHQRGERA